MESISDSQGCGCCADIYDVEGPQEAIDDFDRSQTVWLETRLKQLRSFNQKWSAVHWSGFGCFVVAVGVSCWLKSPTLAFVALAGLGILGLADLIVDMVRNRILPAPFDPSHGWTCGECGHIHRLRTLRLYRRPKTCAKCGRAWMK
jgi:hypothetical protein